MLALVKNVLLNFVLLVLVSTPGISPSKLFAVCERDLMDESGKSSRLSEGRAPHFQPALIQLTNLSHRVMRNCAKKNVFCFGGYQRKWMLL